MAAAAAVTGHFTDVRAADGEPEPWNPSAISTSVAVPLPQPNIDTDQIIPARFLSPPREVDHGQFLFHDARLAPDGTPKPDFPLNQPAWQPAQDRRRRAQLRLRLARARTRSGRCIDAGFRCAIAPSFGDIFSSNGFKNGLLPVVLPAEAVERHHRCSWRLRRARASRSTCPCRR